MTVIKFHGYLKKKYGNSLKLNLGNLNEIVNAVDCIKKDFKKTLFELGKEGKHYSVNISKDNKEIEFLPCLIGTGQWGMLIVGALLLVIGIGAALMFGIAIFTALGAAIGTAGLAGLVSLAGIIGSIMIMGITTMIQGAIIAANYTEPPKMQQQKISAGGAAKAVDDKGKSYLFSQGFNQSSQGRLVPIGYGRLTLGSKLIHSSLKSYSTSQVFENETREENRGIEIYG